MRYIYVVGNSVNWKVYVGQTKNFLSRKKGHLYAARKENPRPLYCSFRKHGEENFVFKILEECEDDIVNEREQYWVAHFDSFNHERGYNLTSGGSQHFECSQETRQKMSNVAKLRKVSFETRQKLSEIAKRRVLSQETRQKISEKTRNPNDETRIKMGIATKKRHQEKRSQISITKECETCCNKFVRVRSLRRTRFCSRNCYLNQKKEIER